MFEILLHADRLMLLRAVLCLAGAIASLCVVPCLAGAPASGGNRAGMIDRFFALQAALRECRMIAIGNGSVGQKALFHAGVALVLSRCPSMAARPTRRPWLESGGVDGWLTTPLGLLAGREEAHCRERKAAAFAVGAPVHRLGTSSVFRTTNGPVPFSARDMANQ